MASPYKWSEWCESNTLRLVPKTSDLTDSLHPDMLEDFFRMIRLTESRMAENQALKEKIRSSEYLKQRKAQGGDESESFRHILDEIGIKPSVREEKVELSQLSFYNKKSFESCLPFLDVSLYEQYAGLVPMVYIDAENNSGIENAFAKDFNETPILSYTSASERASTFPFACSNHSK